jgi:hypothetical protein
MRPAVGDGLLLFDQALAVVVEYEPSDALPETLESSA